MPETNRLANLPEDSFLGMLCWFSISGQVERDEGGKVIDPIRVRREELWNSFRRLGLNTDLLPAPLTRVNAFKSACTHVSGHKYPSNERDVTVELMIRHISADSERIEKQVTMEKRDVKGSRLSYLKVATITFYRGNLDTRKNGGGTYKVRPMSGLDPYDEAHLQHLLTDLRLKYDDLAAHLHGDMVRSIVRNYLKHLNAVSVRGGGLYFVRRAHQEELDGLMHLVRSIGPGCVFGQAPLVDTEEQRQMVTDAYQDSVADECRLLSAEIEEVSAREEIHPSTHARLLEVWRGISARSAEYAEELGLAQERAGAALELTFIELAELETLTTKK